jgi:hypothetical protein
LAAITLGVSLPSTKLGAPVEERRDASHLETVNCETLQQQRIRAPKKIRKKQMTSVWASHKPSLDWTLA